VKPQKVKYKSVEEISDLLKSQGVTRGKTETAGSKKILKPQEVRKNEKLPQEVPNETDKEVSVEKP
jgi:hypothetical protein